MVGLKSNSTIVVSICEKTIHLFKLSINLSKTLHFTRYYIWMERKTEKKIDFVILPGLDAKEESKRRKLQFY